MRQPQVTVRVLPLAEGAFIAIFGPFVILDIGDEENAVLYRESFRDDEIVQVTDAVRYHRQGFERMWERSLNEEASARLIEARAATMLAALDRRMGR